MIQGALQRAHRGTRSQSRPHVMKREYRPAGSPQEQIGLALDAVDVRKKARHQRGGDQQRQRNETLMHQEHIRFSAVSRMILSKARKRERPLRFRARATLECAREDSRAATPEGRARTQNKVPVIMDYAIFRKQVYRRTGGQRDSIVVVTDSVQREVRNAGLFLGSYPPCVLRGTSILE